MPSAALAEWQRTSTARLDELEQVHATVRGAGPGRRWTTRQLNLSLFIALLAQFQTFCRALHDDAVEVHVAAANAAQAQLLRRLLTDNRRLDRGNPTRDALSNDYSRLGLDLVPSLTRVRPSVATSLQRLDTLVSFRNAIAHGNDAQLSQLLTSRKVAANLASFRRFRRSLDKLVVTMDRVVASDLATRLRIPRPW